METEKTEQQPSECFEKLAKKYSKNTIKADIHTLDKLKIALDDLFVEYGKGRGFLEKHTLTDFQNVVGMISVVLAIVVTFQSVTYKFQDTKLLVSACLTVYFVINCVNSIVSYFYGGKILFKEFEASTRIDKTPVYVIVLYWKKRAVPVKYQKNVTELFDDKGVMDHVSFLRDLEKLFKE